MVEGYAVTDIVTFVATGETIGGNINKKYISWKF